MTTLAIVSLASAASAALGVAGMRFSTNRNLALASFFVTVAGLFALLLCGIEAWGGG